MVQILKTSSMCGPKLKERNSNNFTKSGASVIYEVVVVVLTQH